MGNPSAWVFLILLGSYSFFWHARDWNTASRLMLTYALVDSGTIRLDGLDHQTGDIALFEGHYYTDKLPGYSFLGVIPYALCRASGMPPHPLDREGMPYWPGDYAVTLAVSGVATALLGAWLTAFAQGLGVGPRRAALVGLAFGLATPSYPYATLAYGHNITALVLFGAFVLIGTGPARRDRSLCAGLLSTLAIVLELQSAPVAGILGLFIMTRPIVGSRTWRDVAAYALGATFPLLFLAGYNLTAFGKPWDMGYFHHATPRFEKVHSAGNPLGLRPPDWSKLPDLLIGRYRGLLFHAPVLWLAPAGWIVLAVRGAWGLLLVTLSACLAVFLVNLSYPEWTGGWSTGPRLLVPLLPFAMVPVAAILATGSRGVTGLAIVLSIVGGVLMLLYQGVGARIPDLLGLQRLEDPLFTVVWPLWRGDPLPRWWVGVRHSRTLVSMIWPERPYSPEWSQFLPLVLTQSLLIIVMNRLVRRPAGRQAA
jgi:hypothetical protein